MKDKFEKFLVGRLARMKKTPEMFACSTESFEMQLLNFTEMLFEYSKTSTFSKREFIESYQKFLSKNYKTGSCYLSGVTTEESGWKVSKYNLADIAKANTEFLKVLKKDYGTKI